MYACATLARNTRTNAKNNVTMKRYIFAVFCAVGIMFPAQVLAWGQEGHRIIAEVAYHYISSGTRSKIDKVLGKHGMVYVANWADEIKSDTIYPESISEGWHFQDLGGGLSDSMVVAMLDCLPNEGGAMFHVIDSIFALLQKEPTNELALRFFVHLSGDWYCPMHIAHLDDRGGNQVRMKWFGSNTNLHSVWDSKLISSQGYSYTEYAQFLIDTYDKERKNLLKRTKEELVVENYHLTSEIYKYQETFDGNTYYYVYHFHKAMEWQLYKAGVRLAMHLEQIYK